MKKVLLVMLAFAMMLGLCQFSVGAEEELKVVRAIRTDKFQIVVEFSGPVKIVDGNPFMGLRIVDKNGNLMFDNGTPLQFYNGRIDFFDGRYDRVIWTATEGAAGAIIDKTGQYSDFEDYETMFCIEEKFENGKDTEDGTIHNIVHADTGVKLTAGYVGGGTAYDGIYIPIETDYDYFFSGNNNSSDSESGSQTVSQSESQSQSSGNTFTSNSDSSGDDTPADNGNLWLWIGIGAAVVVVAVVVVVVVTKKKKGAKSGDDA